MSDNRILEITEVVDRLVLEIGLPLRTAKTLNRNALRELGECLDELEVILENETTVPKSLVGYLWFIFITMLSEAEYAKDKRQEIETEAWALTEKLRQIFGPKG